jgi:hypothetical protein
VHERQRRLLSLRLNCRPPTCPADPRLACRWPVAGPSLARQTGQAIQLTLACSLPRLEPRSSPRLRWLNFSAFPFWAVAAAASLPREGWALWETRHTGPRKRSHSAQVLLQLVSRQRKKKTCSVDSGCRLGVSKAGKACHVDWMRSRRDLTQDEKLSARTLSSPHSTNAVQGPGGQGAMFFSRDAPQKPCCITVAVLQL